MRKASVLFFALSLLAAWPLGDGEALASLPLTNALQHETHTMSVPVRRRRRVRGDRRRGRGIGHAYGRAGRSAARGAARFAKHTARGRPVRGGKHFGKGMGGFGKHAGIGTARVGKKVGKTLKRVFTP
ncbi:MAG TPA: hypothetical protein VGB73_09345 [Pyrinomonadaceae bacterium]|jgi:hypothetical protein